MQEHKHECTAEHSAEYKEIDYKKVIDHLDMAMRCYADPMEFGAPYEGCDLERLSDEDRDVFETLYLLGDHIIRLKDGWPTPFEFSVTRREGHEDDWGVFNKRGG